MKIDRLLGLVMYLLNRDIVPARVLAEKFEVSPRTIQRDIESLNLAGIPVTSIKGTNGGYGIADGFKIDKQVMNTSDYLVIITALKGLCSAYENHQLAATLEKWLSIASEKQLAPSKIQLDFGVLREGAHTAQYLKMLEAAIDNKLVVEFDYTNAENGKTHRLVEPVAMTYKWYAWYLFGFCREKQDYRLFRLSRIRELTTTVLPFSMIHENAHQLLAEYEQRDNRQYLHVKMICQPELRISVEEYFPKAKISETEADGLLFEFDVPGNERGWFGILMSFGGQLKVLEPEGLQKMLTEKAKQIVEIY